MKVEIALATSKQQLSDAFKHWFKKSKVVDAAHNPLRCFHGTSHDVEWFDPGHHGKQDFGYLGVGFYFTARPNIASSYATSRNEGDCWIRPKRMKRYTWKKSIALFAASVPT